MTSQELYYDFHLLLNKSNEQKSVNIEKGNFVRLYNREAQRWLSDYIEKNNISDNILTINDLIVRDYDLEEVGSNTEQTVYKIPENYFSLIHGDFYSIVDANKCKGIIYNQVAKPNDLNALKDDKFSTPSFHWERGLAKVSDNEIVVFKNNFDIISSFISYYKNISEIDIQGYERLDGKTSEDKNPQESDYICQMILDRVVLEVQRQQENQIGFQVSKERDRQY